MIKLSQIRQHGPASFLCVLVTLAAPCIAGAAPDGKRRFEVHDSIEMSLFTETGRFSPDGSYFVTVTERGVLPEGSREATVWLFNTAAIRKLIAGANPASGTTPVPLARFTAAINGAELGEGIVSQITWDADSRSFVLLGAQGGENHQLFRVRLSDHTTIALTPSTQDVVNYAAIGGSIVYLAAPDVAAARHWWSNDPDAPDIVNGTGQSLMSLLYPNYEKHRRSMPTVFEVWQVHGSTAAAVRNADTGEPMRVLGSYNLNAMALSPDGKRLIATVHSDYIPARWERYEVPKGPGNRPFRGDPLPIDLAHVRTGDLAIDYSRALEYELIDLVKGTRRALIDAPLADFQRGADDPPQAAWSLNGRYVALSETYLPLDTGTRRDRGATRCGLAMIDTRHLAATCLSDSNGATSVPTPDLQWTSAERLLVSSAGTPVAEYRRHGARWSAGAPVTTQHATAYAPLQLRIQQDLDRPPVLCAQAAGTSESTPIFDPNPQLAAIDLGTVSEYSWKDPQGRVIQGGLAKPPGFDANRRYALVIQTHGFNSHEFFRVGSGETAAAGRALAARDLLVLQVHEPRPTGTWDESTHNGLDIYLAGIDQLAAAGLIDPRRVGITGYSRTGMYVAKAITEAPERFAAAALANTDPGALTAYETYIDYSLPEFAQSAANFIAGARPYGDGLQQWIARAPGFHTDRIRAPVLISAADPQHLLSLWGLYAPLRDQGKPVELQYFRNGQHILTKPLEKLAHQEMLVDWFDFWLNGHEDPAPRKAGQYERWRKLHH